MMERDKLFSVYIGNHVAIPHGVSGSEKYIKKSGIAFLQVPEGVDFGPGKTAYVIIAIAGVNDEHLDVLAKLALVCSDPANVEALRSAGSKETVFAILSE